MLIVAGHFDIDPADRDAFLEARSPAMTATRSEGGCLEYVMSADPIDPRAVVLFERWEDQASLDAHMAAVAAPPRAVAARLPRASRSRFTTSPANGPSAETEQDDR